MNKNFNINQEILKLLLRYANQVAIGDEILVLRNNELTSVEVISVSKMTLQGKCFH